MTSILMSVVFISLISLFTRNRYLEFICTGILLFCLWVLFGFSESADLENYRTMFFQASSFNPIEIITSFTGRDKGYMFINSLSSWLGMNFNEFHVVFASGWLFFMIYVSKKITNSTLIVLLLYLLWPFFMDVIQLRTTLVDLLVFIAIYISSKQEKFSDIKACFIVVLACTIHILAIVYLPFFFFKKFHRTKFVMGIVLAISILLPLYDNLFIGILANKISSFVYLCDDATIASFSQYDLALSHFEKYGRWLYLNAALFIMYFIDKTWRKFISQDIVVQNKSYKIGYIDTCYAFCKYVCCFMPLYSITGAEFSRIARIFLLPFIMVIGEYIDIANNDYYRLFVLLGAVCILFTAGFVDLYYALGMSVMQILNLDGILYNMGL